MNTTVHTPYTNEQIKTRLAEIPRLASLRSISSALTDVLGSQYSFTAQIAEIIRRDPSLTSRLLKLVNSVFFGLSNKITNIEEAVFYLGLRQIRELAIATPVIENFEELQSKSGAAGIQWNHLWQHSIGCALMTREILANAGIIYDDDTDYLIGLLHKVGKIAMASAYPEEFSYIHLRHYEKAEEITEQERQLIGWDHTQFAAHYLRRNNIPEEIVKAIENQYHPTGDGRHIKAAAAIQVANHMLYTTRVQSIELIQPKVIIDVKETQGWKTLFEGKKQNSALALAHLKHTLKRLPMTLKGMV